MRPLLFIATRCRCSSWPSRLSSGMSTTSTTSTPTSAATTDLKLDPKHDYGNAYLGRILPVGDGKYVTDGPKQGYVYVCRAPAGGGGGADVRGPWFINDNTEYDLSQKVSVEGTVHWDGSYSMTRTDRSCHHDELFPRDHTTGVFPVQPSDPAYQYDRNPNHIAAQSLGYTLSANPTVRTSPDCVGGEVGVMTTGVASFDAFDAGVGMPACGRCRTDATVIRR